MVTNNVVNSSKAQENKFLIYFFVVWFSYSFLMNYSLVPLLISNVVQYVLILIALIIFAFRVRSLLHVVIVVYLVLLLIVQFFYGNNTYATSKLIGLIVISSIILTAKHDFSFALNKYLIICLFVNAFILIFTILIPVLPNDTTNFANRFRMTFGFNNSNNFPLYSFIPVILSFWLNKKNFIKGYCVLFYLVVAYFSGTRTQLVFLFLFLLLYYLNFKILVNFYLRYFLVFLFTISIIMFFMNINYVYFNYPLLDVLMSNRISLLYQLIHSTDVFTSLLGGADLSNLTIDNAFGFTYAATGDIGFYVLLCIVLFSSIKIIRYNLIKYIFVLSTMFVMLSENIFSPFVVWAVLFMTTILDPDYLGAKL